MSAEHSYAKNKILFHLSNLLHQTSRIGVYKRGSGEFDIKTYYKDAPQEGVRWSSDKTKAWKLLSGDAVEELSLEEADVFRNNVCDASPFLAFILR